LVGVRPPPPLPTPYSLEGRAGWGPAELHGAGADGGWAEAPGHLCAAAACGRRRGDLRLQVPARDGQDAAHPVPVWRTHLQGVPQLSRCIHVVYSTRPDRPATLAAPAPHSHAGPSAAPLSAHTNSASGGTISASVAWPAISAPDSRTRYPTAVPADDKYSSSTLAKRGSGSASGPCVWEGARWYRGQG
jgi:hypothetical protein